MGPAGERAQETCLFAAAQENRQMSLLRWNPKRDKGEKAIVEALERSGCLVERLSGRGVADLLVARYAGTMNVRLYLLEIKERKGKLTAAQQMALEKGWPIMIARTVEQALHCVGVMRD